MYAGETQFACLSLPEKEQIQQVARPLRGLAIFLCANVKLSLKEEVMDLSFFV